MYPAASKKYWPRRNLKQIDKVDVDVDTILLQESCLQPVRASKRIKKSGGSYWALSVYERHIRVVQRCLRDNHHSGSQTTSRTSTSLTFTSTSLTTTRYEQVGLLLLSWNQQNWISCLDSFLHANRVCESWTDRTMWVNDSSWLLSLPLSCWRCFRRGGGGGGGCGGCGECWWCLSVLHLSMTAGYYGSPPFSPCLKGFGHPLYRSEPSNLQSPVRHPKSYEYWLPRPLPAACHYRLFSSHKFLAERFWSHLGSDRVYYFCASAIHHDRLIHPMFPCSPVFQSILSSSQFHVAARPTPKYCQAPNFSMRRQTSACRYTPSTALNSGCCGSTIPRVCKLQATAQKCMLLS